MCLKPYSARLYANLLKYGQKTALFAYTLILRNMVDKIIFNTMNVSIAIKHLRLNLN